MNTSDSWTTIPSMVSVAYPLPDVPGGRFSQEKCLDVRTVPYPTPAVGSPGPLVGCDPVDLLDLKTLPEPVRKAAQPTFKMTTTALASEGGRGPAARRLLARDVNLGRVRLRYYEGLLNLAVQDLVEGRGSERRVRTLERLADGQHRRLLGSLELLARMDTPTASVRVVAHQAAVMVSTERA